MSLPIEKQTKSNSIFFILGSCIAVLVVAICAMWVMDVYQNKKGVKGYVTQIAGEAITRTSSMIVPDNDEKRYYSVLVMGIDTRGVTFDGKEYIPDKRDGTRKIDVIMQVLYDRQTNKLTFISIPRDTSLPVTEECMHQEREDQKYINRIYDMAEKNNCPESGADMMMKYVSYITGFEIDHYIIVTLDGFVSLIDVVGDENNGKKGMWIDIPKTVSDYCPNDRYGYDYVYYPAGNQFLTSKQVLCYIRVRKTSNDFDRARRQQFLMDNILNRVMQNSNLNNPLELYALYKSISKDMQMSQISLEDIGMGLEILQNAQLDNIQKIVLDDQFGGENVLLTKPLYSRPGTHTRSGYYLIPTAWDQACCQTDEWLLVRNYLHKLIDNPDAVNEQALIYAYANKYTNGKAIYNNESYNTYKANLASEMIIVKESKYAQPMLASGSDIQVFDFSSGQKRSTAQKVAKILGGEVYDGSIAPFKPLNNEEISIVVRVN